jgi:hypothetical protein
LWISLYANKYIDLPSLPFGHVVELCSMWAFEKVSEYVRQSTSSNKGLAELAAQTGAASRSASQRGLPSASQKSKDHRFELLKEPVSRDNGAETKKRPLGKHTSFGMDRG